MTTTQIPEQHSPVREIVAYLAIVYSMTLAIAVALPNAHINLLLSVAVPTVAVTILTFTMFKRGTRRELWRGIGLGRAGLRSWLPALVLPVLLSGAAYGTAVLVGAGRWGHLDISTAAITNGASVRVPGSEASTWPLQGPMMPRE